MPYNDLLVTSGSVPTQNYIWGNGLIATIVARRAVNDIVAQTFTKKEKIPNRKIWDFFDLI